MITRTTTQQWDSYQKQAKDLGFLEMAAAAAEPVKRSAAVRQWVRDGHHAEMHWYERSLEKRLNPQLVMEDAQSVIILTAAYHHQPCTLAGKSLARYACGDDYHDVLLAKLKTLCAAMQRDFPEGHFRPYVDTGPILERYWAERAGIGWIGKNGNLISRKDGSYLFLASILTNVAVPCGQPHDPFCGSCRACIDVCPTQAFYADGLLDSRKCISYLNIEHRGPFENAPDFDNWIFGCDLCQEVCPWTGKFSNAEPLPELRPRPGYQALSANVLAEMDQPTFSATFRKSPIKRTKLAGLQRNLRHLQCDALESSPD